MSDQAPPERLVLHRRSRELEVGFSDGDVYRLPAEYLRVYSRSAEVRGHGAGQEKLVTGKREVAIERVEPVGNYAVCLYFSDGHDSGIYSWEYLRELGRDRDHLWNRYLKQLLEQGGSRE
ncbi:MAG: DUF971 domain-containing protein [Pseudomonadota bacterium]|nr:DUF971 domain-containing protein [Pseudomonadota bacterium]